MARDRKRARQRRERGKPPVAPKNQVVRRELPGSLDHASGDVDEFDAALVAGGIPVEEDEAPITASEGSGSSGGGARESSGGGGGEGKDEGGSVSQPSGPPQRSGIRAIGFLRASWAELQRVQWPDRPQVTQATAVVLGFVVIAGAYLGAADWVAQKIVNFIL